MLVELHAFCDIFGKNALLMILFTLFETAITITITIRGLMTGPTVMMVCWQESPVG